MLKDDSATRPKEEKMKILPQVLFWLGLISVPFALAGMVLGASDGNGEASACKY
jgi:hypothetical protein